jgi:hypothetical protein
MTLKDTRKHTSLIRWGGSSISSLTVRRFSRTKNQWIELRSGSGSKEMRSSFKLVIWNVGASMGCEGADGISYGIICRGIVE